MSEQDSFFQPAKEREPDPPGDIVRGLVTFRELGYVFEITTRPGEMTYDIEASRILVDTRQFTDWIWQLHGRSWMTGQHYADLLECLSEVIYRTYGEWPQVHYMVEGSI